MDRSMIRRLPYGLNIRIRDRSLARMFSTKEGEPIATVCGGKQDGKLLRLNRDAEAMPDKINEIQDEDLRELIRSVFNESDFKTDGEMVIIPSAETERMYLAGKSGCGKSTLAARYMCAYKNMFPERRILLFSRHTDEKAYQGIDHTAIALDDDLANEPLDLSEIKDSLVVFDDTDNLQDKKIKKALSALNDDIISNGRKYNIHCLTLAHQLLNYTQSRNLLNEANRVVFFNNGTTYHIKNYLQKYAGIDATMIKKILGLKTRWTLISLGTPMYILHEHGAFLLSNGR